MDFKIQLNDNISDRQEQVIKEALQEISKYITDNITVNLAFTNASTLGNHIKGVALPNSMGGLDEEMMDFYEHYRDGLPDGADDDVITLREFKDALDRDRRSSVDNQFVANIDSNGTILGSVSPVSTEIRGIELTTANAKAVGLTGANAGDIDAIISLNKTDVNSLTDAQLKSLVMHEVGHALGFTSAVDSLPERFGDLTALEQDYVLGFQTDQGYAMTESYKINPLDLGRYAERITTDGTYRYNALHPRFKDNSYFNGFEKLYFSIDGGQTSIGELALGTHHNVYVSEDSDNFYFQGSHWNDVGDIGIMNGAFDRTTQFNTFSNVDLIAFDAIGYDVNYNGNGNIGSVQVVDWNSDLTGDLTDGLHNRYRGQTTTSRHRTTTTTSLGTSSTTAVAGRFSLDPTDATANTAEYSYENFLNELTSQVFNVATDFRLQANQFDVVVGFREQQKSFAWGGTSLDLGGGWNQKWGRVEYTVQQAGTYNLYLGGFDESGGQSSFWVDHNDTRIGEVINDRQLGQWASDSNTAVRDLVGSNVELEVGDTIKIVARRNYGDRAWIDYLDFEAVHENPSGSGSNFKLEAESFDLDGYRVESLGSASGGKALSFVGGATNESGFARYTFDTNGTYNISLAAFDENDGSAKIDLRLNGSSIGVMNLDRDLGDYGATGQTLRSETVAREVTVRAGDILTVKGFENAGEHARLDYLEFEALHSDITGAGSDTSSGSASAFKLEAESFNLNGYRVENLGSASGSKALSFVGGAGWESGSANYTFDRHGTYDVSLTAFDENDGYAKIDLHLNGSSIGVMNLDQNLGHYGASEQTLRSQTVAYGIDFAPGDVLTVKGYEKAGEHARLDYLEFTPSF